VQSSSDSIDSAIITGSLALLVGLGIFFTLGFRLDPHTFYPVRGGEEGQMYKRTDDEIRFLKRIMIFMFWPAVILTLFPGDWINI
jgi:hypothetical protein